jgi:hypothetical protein
VLGGLVHVQGVQDIKNVKYSPNCGVENTTQEVINFPGWKDYAVQFSKDVRK